MRKWHSVLFLMLLSNIGWAQSGKNLNQSQSSTMFIIIGALLLIVIVFMLYNKQKRKFND